MVKNILFSVDRKQINLEKFLDITLDADKYVLINLYNANTETERVKILEELVKINALSLQMILISFLIKS